MTSRDANFASARSSAGAAAAGALVVAAAGSCTLLPDGPGPLRPIDWANSEDETTAARDRNAPTANSRRTLVICGPLKADTMSGPASGAQSQPTGNHQFYDKLGSVHQPILPKCLLHRRLES